MQTLKQERYQIHRALRACRDAQYKMRLADMLAIVERQIACPHTHLQTHCGEYSEKKNATTIAGTCLFESCSECGLVTRSEAFPNVHMPQFHMTITSLDMDAFIKEHIA